MWEEPIKASLKLSVFVASATNLIGFIVTTITRSHKPVDLSGAAAFVFTTLILSKSSYERLQGFEKLYGPSLLNNRLVWINFAVIIWGTRLGSYLFMRVLKLGEDERLRMFFPKDKNEGYLEIKNSFFPVKLAGFWFFHNLWAILCLLPLTTLNALPRLMNDSKSSNEILSSLEIFPQRETFPLFSSLSVASIAALYTGIAVQATADYQKDYYKTNVLNEMRKEEGDPNLDHWCDYGIWRLSRHPNYFGDIMTWSSLYVACSLSLVSLIRLNPARFSPSFYSLLAVGLLSPLTVTGLLLMGSGVPILEAKYEEKYNDKNYKFRNEWIQYKQNTNLLFPWPNGGNRGEAKKQH